MADKVCILVITDGRKDCMSKMMASWYRDAKFNSRKTGSYRILIDDSGDLDYFLWLRHNFQDKFDQIVHHKARMGFGATIIDAWSKIPVGCNFVLHLEDDFILNRPVVIEDMVDILKAYPRAAQIALYRQPWNAEEIAAGGFYKQYPDLYHDNIAIANGIEYPVVVQTRNFTTNPCLYPRTIMEHGWPEGEHSEGHFGIKLLSKGYHFLYMGSLKDDPWVTHIGQSRIGTGY
jgi:hypothetical protein